ncbi:MAG: 50S ribosomal protein L9 [Limisphaerales bacterium]
MAKTEVILLKHIVGLGAESDQVKVAAGYARNYLLPQGLAIPVTAANKRRLEVLRQRRAEREAQELNTMSDLAKSLQKLVLKVKVKTGEDGKMFGSVTNGMIADELKHQFDISLDKRKIQTDHGLKALGEHEVALNLHPDVKATLKVIVESLNPPPAPEEGDAKKDKADEGKADRRRPRAPRTEKPAAKPEAA